MTPIHRILLLSITLTLAILNVNGQTMIDLASAEVSSAEENILKQELETLIIRENSLASDLERLDALASKIFENLVENGFLNKSGELLQAEPGEYLASSSNEYEDQLFSASSTTFAPSQASSSFNSLAESTSTHSFKEYGIYLCAKASLGLQTGGGEPQPEIESLSQNVRSLGFSGAICKKLDRKSLFRKDYITLSHVMRSGITFDISIGASLYVLKKPNSWIERNPSHYTTLEGRTIDFVKKLLTWLKRAKSVTALRFLNLEYGAGAGKKGTSGFTGWIGVIAGAQNTVGYIKSDVRVVDCEASQFLQCLGVRK